MPRERRRSTLGANSRYEDTFVRWAAHSIPIESKRGWHMRYLHTLLAATVLSMTCFPVDVALAQNHQERRAIEKSVPVYPELAKRGRMKGIVKIEVVVRCNGTVKSTRILGGNPVFLDSATEAVRKWRFQPAGQETTELVQVAFEAP